MNCIYELVITNKHTEEVIERVCCFDGMTKLQDLADVCYQLSKNGFLVTGDRYIKLTDNDKLSLYTLVDGVRKKYV